MQHKSDNNNQHQNNVPPPPPAKTHRPNYLPVPVAIPVNVQVDYDESDRPILYRDDEDENMSEEGSYQFAKLPFFLETKKKSHWDANLMYDVLSFDLLQRDWHLE